MSSACVCHTDEWCFYCNMYRPLEVQHNALIARVERVIEELETKRKNHKVESYKNVSTATSAFHEGHANGLLDGIEMLKEVLSKHEGEARAERDSTTSKTIQ